MRRKRRSTHFEYRNFIPIVMLKADETSGNVLFEEKQKFPNWLTILMAGIILLTIVITLIAGLTTKEDKGDLWIALGISIPVEILVIILFWNVHLEKVVTSNGLYYRWRPWQKKFRVIEKESIKGFEVRNSPPLNYGIHWFPGYGWVHNASAGEGLQLYLVNGKKIFFSTLNTIFFQRALENITSSNPKPRVSEF
jgi:hypothetical protein